ANWALREVLGDEVQQKGSLVDPEKLRFDFSHNKAMSEEEVGRVESLVAQCVEKKMTVYAEVAPQEQALKIHGLRAVFGEKYPPMVRVVSIGVPVADLLKDPQNPKWRQYSIEFCGGTHLRRTDETGGFVVLSEESVSKGIRRIVALTGDAAADAQRAARQVDGLIEMARRTKEPELPTVIAELNRSLSASNLPLRARRRGHAALAEAQARLKTFEKAQQKAGGGGADVMTAASKLLAEAHSLGSGKLIVGEIPGAAPDQLLSAADSLKAKSGSYGIMLASAENGKVSFVAAVSDDLIAKGLKAGDWIKATATVAGGGGGGRPQMAQAGGKDPTKLKEALEAARRFATERVGS
ncbi:MAG TPA: DHHA1 domain-containing protein, partial [Tepidisphaeraceae bacterium]|nr:DHHA1 domain-containing protein [Tepidisphaeraceae bacterium]